MDVLINKQLIKVHKALQDLSFDSSEQNEILDFINDILETRKNLVVDNDESVVTGCRLIPKVNEYVVSSAVDPSVPDTDSGSVSENRDRNITCDEDKNKKEALDYYKSKIENLCKDYVNKHKNVEYVYVYNGHFMDDDYFANKDKYDKEFNQIIKKLKKYKFVIKEYFSLYRKVYKSRLELTKFFNIINFMKTEEGKKLLNDVEFKSLFDKFSKDLISSYEEILMRRCEMTNLRDLLLENDNYLYFDLDYLFINKVTNDKSVTDSGFIENKDYFNFITLKSKIEFISIEYLNSCFEYIKKAKSPIEILYGYPFTPVTKINQDDHTNDNKNTGEKKKLLSVEEFKSMVDEYVNNLKLTEKNVSKLLDEGGKLKKLLVNKIIIEINLQTMNPKTRVMITKTLCDMLVHCNII